MYWFRASSYQAWKRRRHLDLATNINYTQNRRDGPYVFIRRHVLHEFFMTRIGGVVPAGGFRGEADSSWARASHASRASLSIVARCTDSYSSRWALLLSSRRPHHSSRPFIFCLEFGMVHSVERGHLCVAVDRLRGVEQCTSRELAQALVG